MKSNNKPPTNEQNNNAVFKRRSGKHNTTKPLNCKISFDTIEDFKRRNQENPIGFEHSESSGLYTIIEGIDCSNPKRPEINSFTKEKNENQNTKRPQIKSLNLERNENSFLKRPEINLKFERFESSNIKRPEIKSLTKENIMNLQKKNNYTYYESKYSKNKSDEKEGKSINNENANTRTIDIGERGRRTKSVESLTKKYSKNQEKNKENITPFIPHPPYNIKNQKNTDDKNKKADNSNKNLPPIPIDTNKYNTKTFAATKIGVDKNKETKNEKNIQKNENKTETKTLDKNKSENNQTDDKNIVRRRRPNFPKYERRVSDKNIVVKKKEEEEKVVKLENSEQGHKRRKSIDTDSRRLKSPKKFSVGSEFSQATNIKLSEATSTAGRDDDGLTKINQDTYILERNVNGVLNFNIFGVLDGHGVNGHLASQFVKRYIINRITNISTIKNLDSPKEIYKKLIENGYQIIANIFCDADVQITKEKFNCEMSGTTCVIVIQLEEHLICANTGDSRGILVYDDSNGNNLNKTKIYLLSYDCKPELPNEKKRIEEAGGSVERMMDEGDIPCGPFRVWIKGEEYPGLAMSRSIGDMDAKKVGVIPNPQIVEYTLNPKSKYMIICSDGIWEFISNEEVMKIANRYYLRNDALGLCNDLTNISTALWLKEDIVVDDITVVVVFF